MTDAWTDTPLLAEVDVCVGGAGSAGSTAAIAAARTDAYVPLIDRLPFLGGTSTAVHRLRQDGAIVELDAASSVVPT